MYPCSFALSQLITGTTPNILLFSVEELEASLRLNGCVTSGWHNIAVWFAQMFCLHFSFVIVLIFVRFARCNYFISFLFHKFIILGFVLTEGSALILVFITKIALLVKKEINYLCL